MRRSHWRLFNFLKKMETLYLSLFLSLLGLTLFCSLSSYAPFLSVFSSLVPNGSPLTLMEMKESKRVSFSLLLIREFRCFYFWWWSWCVAPFRRMKGAGSVVVELSLSFTLYRRLHLIRWLCFLTILIIYYIYTPPYEYHY